MRLFENGLCAGASLPLESRRPHPPNPVAIGALVALTTSDARQIRDSYFGFSATMRPPLPGAS